MREAGLRRSEARSQRAELGRPRSEASDGRFGDALLDVACGRGADGDPMGQQLRRQRAGLAMKNGAPNGARMDLR